MQVLTSSGGEVRRGRVWFTTSPEQLKRESRESTTTKTVKVVRRRRNGKIESVGD